MSQKAIEKTGQWLSGWVIRHDLCPFAKFPFQKGRVRIVSSESEDSDSVFNSILAEIEYLLQTDARQVETTLLVMEKMLSDFGDYLEFVDLIEQVIQQTGLEGQIQVASFHPLYCFADAPEDDPANYTNRSPYPMFHLIREASLEKALESYADPESIPLRNIELLRSLGIEEIKRQLEKIR